MLLNSSEGNMADNAYQAACTHDRQARAARLRTGQHSTASQHADTAVMLRQMAGAAACLAVCKNSSLTHQALKVVRSCCPIVLQELSLT